MTRHPAKKKLSRKPSPSRAVSASADAIARQYVLDIWNNSSDAMRACAVAGKLSNLDRMILRGRYGLDAFTTDARFALNRQAAGELERAIVAYCVRDVMGRTE